MAPPDRLPSAQLEMTPDALLRRARRIRDLAHGTRVTYSPKVFIPLTMLCRDKCGYCTFAKAPARLDSPYLTPEQVVRIARRARPSAATRLCSPWASARRTATRWPADWLAAQGYGSTVDYLAAMCRLVLDETGLLPHANAGALFPDELAQLRTVSASQGMMIETLREDLAAHRGAPDKTPARRLATLESAGRLGIPFTTGILVGIGEDRSTGRRPWRPSPPATPATATCRRSSSRTSCPNRARPCTGPRPCPTDEFVDAIALARMHPPARRARAGPPNLSDDFGALLDAGIDDWGGVSPVTADHVNPERPWPALDVCGPSPRSGASSWRPGSPSIPTFVAAPGAVARRGHALRGDGPQRRRPGWPGTTRARCTPRRWASTRTWATGPRWCWSGGVPPSGTRAPTCTRPPSCRERPGPEARSRKC